MDAITFKPNATKVPVATPAAIAQPGYDMGDNDRGPWGWYWACAVALFLMYLA